jgi:hypothetical protein
MPDQPHTRPTAPAGRTRPLGHASLAAAGAVTLLAISVFAGSRRAIPSVDHVADAAQRALGRLVAGLEALSGTLAGFVLTLIAETIALLALLIFAADGAARRRAGKGSRP